MSDHQNIQILEETNNYVAIHKPSGIHSVKTAKSNNLSIVDILPDYLSQYRSTSPSPLDGGIVNRLDYETSGVLIIAKSRSSWDYLHNQYKLGEVAKEYYCIVEPSPNSEISNYTKHSHYNPIILEGYLGSASRNSPKIRWFKTPPAHKYRARFISLNICQISILTSNEILLTINTIYGIRHQIRAGCAAMGSPLIGDKLYGSQKNLENLKLLSFFLHSHSVNFIDQNGLRTNFRSDIVPELVLSATKFNT